MSDNHGRRHCVCQRHATVALIVTSAMLGFFLSRSVAQTYPPVSPGRSYTGSGYSLCGSCTVPKEISSTLHLTSMSEPGEPIILRGTIYKEDGITPDSGITLFLYQTDAGGYYHRPQEDVFHPRIFGWLRTGRDGKYEIHTVRPGPEVLTPKEPAHIHVHVFSKDIPEHFLHEFWFQADTNISAAERKKFSALGDFSPIVTLEHGKDSIWRGSRNVRLRPAARWKYEDE